MSVKHRASPLLGCFIKVTQVFFITFLLILKFSLDAPHENTKSDLKKTLGKLLKINKSRLGDK